MLQCFSGKDASIGLYKFLRLTVQEYSNWGCTAPGMPMDLLDVAASPHTLFTSLDICKSSTTLLPGSADRCLDLQSRGKCRPRGIVCSAGNLHHLLLTDVIDDSLCKRRPEYHVVQVLILHPGGGAAGTAEMDHCMLLDRTAPQERLILAWVQEAVEVLSQVLAVTGCLQHHGLWRGDIQISKPSTATCLQRRVELRLEQASPKPQSDRGAPQ